MALVIWNYFKTVLIWEIFNPNYDFQVSLCLCLVKKYWKSAVANEKCFFASWVDYKHLNSVQVAKTLVICNSTFTALVIWNYFKTVLIWKIFKPNYDFLVPLCFYLVQKYEKNAVANDKCVFATCTEFSILQTLHINLDIFPWRFVSAK
jgi:hypothetical protein